MTDLETESSLIQGALVRQIRDAGRWADVVEAWEALLKVRLIASKLLKEHKHLSQCHQGSFSGTDASQRRSLKPSITSMNKEDKEK